MICAAIAAVLFPEMLAAGKAETSRAIPAEKGVL
jgi:hypothetical protein